MFNGDTTSGKLLAGFFHLLRATMPTTSASDAPVLTESLMGLLRALVSAGDASSIEARSGVLTALQRYIDQNLGDPGLGVETICAHFRMSRATLYRILKAQGGVRDYIQRRRLMLVFKALAAPGNIERGVFDIALEYGFVNAGHFSTRFREHFGHVAKRSPRGSPEAMPRMAICCSREARKVVSRMSRSCSAGRENSGHRAAGRRRPSPRRATCSPGQRAGTFRRISSFHDHISPYDLKGPGSGAGKTCFTQGGLSGRCRAVSGPDS